MFDHDECERCGHARSAHESFAAGGCGSRVRVAGRVKICGCSEFRGASQIDEATGHADVRASTTPDTVSDETLVGLS